MVKGDGVRIKRLQDFFGDQEGSAAAAGVSAGAAQGN
jgi:hypothetical protein